MKITQSLLFSLMLFWFASPVVSAAEDYLEARRLVDEGIILPLNLIIVRARQNGMTGRVIDVAFSLSHGRYLYIVDVLDKTGNIHEVVFDASNGIVLDVNEGK